MIELTLTKEQKSAISSLERAFRKCDKANIYFHNCYGTLIAYDNALVESVDDDKDDIPCYEGVKVESPYDIASWADDNHYVHLKEE